MRIESADLGQSHILQFKVRGGVGNEDVVHENEAGPQKFSLFHKNEDL